ncbi:MAG: hypothetical protein U9R68_11075, partial [Planctomycetota bacterium]|nr:hypothetical protein [Planctomycetota bacterium]
MLATAALACLVAGCDSGEEPAPLPPSDDPVVRTFDLSRDPAVVDLGRRVAWYYAHGGRLPADLKQVRAFVQVPGWSDLPATTRQGQAVTYRPTGERAFEIVVGDPAGPAGDRTAIA